MKARKTRAKRKGKADQPKRSGPGRPTKRTPELDGILYGALAHGATDDEAATLAGICRKTLHTWRKDDPDLEEHLSAAKARADHRVQDTLFKLATGQVVVQDVPHVTKLGTVILVDEPQAPSYPAIRLWLTNRMPEDWRDRVTLEGDPNRPVEVTVTERPWVDTPADGEGTGD